jgi:hypothetical protein
LVPVTVPWNLSGGLLRYYLNCPVQIDQQQSLITLLLSTTTSADTNSDSSALWPEVIEDECGDEESEKDSSDSIADVIEIGIGRVAPVGNQARFATASAALASL